MTLSQRLEKFKENWPYKILSLLLAIVLYAFYQISQLDTRVFSIPLEVKTNGGFITGNYIEKDIRISVKGKPELVAQLENKDFYAFIDCSHYTEEGEYDVPIRLELSEAAAVLDPLEVKIKPQKIPVTLEKKTIKDVPIDCRFLGEVKEGFRLVSTSINPPSVRIMGGSSAVGTVEKIPASVVYLENKDESFTERVNLINKNDLITLDSGSVAMVNVEIEEIMENKDLLHVPVKMINTQDNLAYESSVDFINISVKGSQNFLKNFKLSLLYSAYIDCSGITEEGTYSLEVRIPDINGLEIIKNAPMTAEITVTPIPEEELPETVVEKNQKGKKRDNMETAQ